VSRQSLDAPDDLPKQAPRQVTLGQLEDDRYRAQTTTSLPESVPRKTSVARHSRRIQAISSGA